MTLPNLVIGGAPRCGTTSLYRWLTDHPEVSGATVKETFYLMDRDYPFRPGSSSYHDSGLDGYAEFFREARPETAQVILEATSQYLYQDTARKVLVSLPTTPRIIFIFRNPAARVYSAFQYARNNAGSIPVHLSFSRFVEIAEGRTGPPVPGLPPRIVELIRREIAYSRYADYLPAWFETFGRHRIYVVALEELKLAPRRVLGEIAEFAGIDPSFFEGYPFAKENRSIALKMPSVHRFAKRAAWLIPGGRIREGAKQIYLRAQSFRARGGLTEADREVLLRLDREFEEPNQRLFHLLGRTLPGWTPDRKRERGG